MSESRKEEFDATHAYFIGPKGSNLPDFRANINTILDELLAARQAYYPEDQAFISKEVRRSEKFLQVRTNLRLATEKVAQLLGEHSAPFWSPRYEGHMCTDLTMSSLLGYFMTMLYNPNNVALEASPMTTLVELRVGQQLCKLFGYNIDEFKSPLAWGHITCGGTVANLESIWVARNLKFYPLSLSLALKFGKLKYIGDHFYAPSSHPSPKRLFKDLDSWELLNLRPEVILNLQDDLSKQFGITSQFLEGALKEYNIQSVGRAPLENAFKIQNAARYFVSKTRHYSWPKGAAIAGLGSNEMVGIDINDRAEIDLDKLEAELLKCVKTKTAVYAVVAVIGSTEEGTVDRLSEILRLRKKFQEEHGLSFLVHADAAWGGYFATMVNRDKHHGAPAQSCSADSIKPEPEWYLDPKTVEDLRAMEDADSITVDPHKAGYIPYPAGSLVYRDGRMRHLVTWSGPYLSQGSAENIGVYGVEGSKPGAAAMSAWFSNQTIGLNPGGYGRLLGEAAFTSARLSAHYATMINKDYICVPFNMLPAEKGGDRPFFSAPVENQRKKIKELIVDKTDEEIFKSEDAMKLIRDLGSDLTINAFTLNWKDKDGNLNNDVEEANYFMKRIVDRLSITTANTDPTTIPIFLTSTQFAPDDYGKCAQTFMKRMGVKPCEQSLFVVRNVVMSPFPTQNGFLKNLMKDLDMVIREEVEVCRKRNEPGRKKLQFLVQGSPDSPEVSLVFKASFHGVTRRQQVILSATLDDEMRNFYRDLIKDGRDVPVMVESDDRLFIMEVVKAIQDHSQYEMPARLFEKGTRKYHAKGGTVTLKAVVKSRPLNSPNRDGEYPSEFMPFYLYGTQQEIHISHMLVKAPNIALSASNVRFQPNFYEPALLAEGLILGLTDIPEKSMQPFVEKNKDLPDAFFFDHGKKFNVKVWKDPKGPNDVGPRLLQGLGEPIYEGELIIGENVFVDAEGPNGDKRKDIKVEPDTWQKKLDEIGSMLDGTHIHKC